jgi:hypothetical protein
MRTRKFVHAHRSIELRIVLAVINLLMIFGGACLLRYWDSPWPFWGLLWFTAIRWSLMLIMDLEVQLEDNEDEY